MNANLDPAGLPDKRAAMDAAIAVLAPSGALLYLVDSEGTFLTTNLIAPTEREVWALSVQYHTNLIATAYANLKSIIALYVPPDQRVRLFNSLCRGIDRTLAENSDSFFTSRTIDLPPPDQEP